MAMHVGMSDLSVFRYAKKPSYALASASGMYVGHFMAWLSASMLFAFQLHETLLTPEQIQALVATGKYTQEALQNTPLTSELIGELMSLGALSGPPTPLPGPLAYGAAGLAGLFCVIIAGWTTANPTIYRAGLAFQAITPRTSRFTVTLITGAVATCAGMFPALAMKLLDFVALYGMILMPMGAVIFVDFWLSNKFGFKNNYAERTSKSFNWAAGLAWFITLAVCTYLVKRGGVQIYFVSLPGWFVAAAIYIILSKVIQGKSLPAQAPLPSSSP
jgi:purine-cytosine permease-like protein